MMNQERISLLRQDIGMRGTALALAHEEKQFNWTEIGAFIDYLDDRLNALGIAAGARIALLARNRPAHFAAMMALLTTRRSTVLINSSQGKERLHDEVSGCVAIIGSPTDLDFLRQSASLHPLAVDSFDTVLLASELVIALPTKAVSAPAMTTASGNVIEVSTSGTTGKPKRIGYDLQAVFGSATNTIDLFDEIEGAADSTRLRPPMVMFYPLANISGMGFLIDSLISGRGLVLLGKFAVEPWLQANLKWPQQVLFLPPTAIRMLLDAGVSKKDLPDALAIRTGSAPLEERIRDEIENRLDIPVMRHYGASEFCGIVTSIPLASYKDARTCKSGTVGRARKGVQLRIVDPASGIACSTGKQGLLEVRTDRIGKQWIRTTDLAHLDEDGYLYIDGRIDDAINRGGFKIVPEIIANALREHPAVRDATAIGWPDARLGEVPIAAIEKRGADVECSESNLLGFLKSRLISYQVPVRIYILPMLPRTSSLKIDRGALRRVITELENP